MSIEDILNIDRHFLKNFQTFDLFHTITYSFFVMLLLDTALEALQKSVWVTPLK